MLMFYRSSRYLWGAVADRRDYGRWSRCSAFAKRRGDPELFRGFRSLERAR